MRIRHSPSEVYQDDVQAGAPADLTDRVLSVLLLHRGPDCAVSRRDLVQAVFGVRLPVDTNLANSILDRQIREAIGKLQATYPILSSSGQGGYWMPASMAEVSAYTAELTSRAANLLAKASRLERAARYMLEEPPQMELPFS